MKFYLSTTKHKYNFWDPIIETIKKYYPIGIKSDSPNYQLYPGQIELGKIVVDNIHSKKVFKSRWQDFDKQLKTESKKKIYGTTYATKPSFSSDLIIKRHTHADLIHIKKIHYVVSLIGPFYTIYGVDETAIKDNRDGHDVFYGAINVITVSPYKEYEEYFIFLKENIEKRFEGYKFVPFGIHSMFIENLYDPYPTNDDEECTIYSALFDDAIGDYNTLRMRGDKRYGYDNWS